MNRRIVISLKPPAKPEKIFESSSVCTMKCLKGSHKIIAIKFSFQDISQKEFIVISLKSKMYRSNNLTQNPKWSSTSDYVLRKKENVFYFSAPLVVFPGNVLIFEGRVVDNTPINLFQLNQDSFSNDHFQCYVQSEPEEKQLYFINEVRYIPFERVFRPRGRK